ncbi:hypothetical protein [Streptosporangium sp. NPDC004631]
MKTIKLLAPAAALAATLLVAAAGTADAAPRLDVDGRLTLTTASGPSIVIPFNDGCTNLGDELITGAHNDTPALALLWSDPGCHDRWYPRDDIPPGHSTHYDPGIHVGSVSFYR